MALPAPSFLVSVLYSKAKLASACGGIIYFLSYVPYMYVAIMIFLTPRKSIPKSPEGFPDSFLAY